MINKSKPSIAFLNPSSKLGGAEISLLELLKATMDHFNYIVIIPDEGELSLELKKIGVPSLLIEWSPFLLSFGERGKNISLLSLIKGYLAAKGVSKKLASILSSSGIACLITNGIKCHVIGAFVKPKYKGKLIWYMREIFDDRKTSQKILRLFQKKVDKIIAISHSVKQSCESFLTKELVVIYNIVDFEKFNPNTEPAEDLKKNKKEVWFCTVGALTQIKGQDLLLEAAEVVLQTFPNTKYFLVGDNSYQTESYSDYARQLKSRVESSDLLRDKVVFLGYRNDLNKVLALMDILVQPNRGPEGLGRSVLEAMAMAKPVIVVDKWGPSEIVEDNITGLKFKLNNKEDLVQKMVDSLLSKDRRQELSSKGFERVKELSNVDKIKLEFTTALNRLLIYEGN